MVAHHLKRLEEEMDSLRKDEERRERKWKARVEQLQVKVRKDKKRMEERLRRLEEKIEGKRKIGGSESDWSDWEEWQSDSE